MAKDPERSTTFSRAARWNLVLCGANLVPALLLAALGYSAASAVGEDHRFNFATAFLLPLLILDLPLLAAWALLRRGHWLGKLLGVTLPLGLTAAMVFLMLGVVSAEFVPLFKILCGLLAVAVSAMYAWGLFLTVRGLFRKEPAGVGGGRP